MKLVWILPRSRLSMDLSKVVRSNRCVRTTCLRSDALGVSLALPLALTDFLDDRSLGICVSEKDEARRAREKARDILPVSLLADRASQAAWAKARASMVRAAVATLQVQTARS